MKEYHKIDSIFMRDLDKPKKPFIIGSFCDPAVEYLKDTRWEWTEKVDGTNIRVMFNGEKVWFGGKSDNSSISANLYVRLQEIFNPAIIEKMKEMFVKEGEETQVCLYGEGFGGNIQGKVGVQYLGAQVDFYLFDIRIGQWWLNRDAVADIGTKLGLILPHVVGYGTVDEAIALVKQGFPSHFGSAMAEGLVLRPGIELYNKKGERIITKVKVRDFK